MKLTKQQAIKECKELWEEIAKSGLSKWDFIHSKVGKGWRDKYESDCPLCEYTDYTSFDNCGRCPLPYTGYERCRRLGYEFNSIPSKKWLNVIRGL